MIWQNLLSSFTFKAPQQELAVKYAESDNSGLILIGIISALLIALAATYFIMKK